MDRRQRKKADAGQHYVQPRDLIIPSGNNRSGSQRATPLKGMAMSMIWFPPSARSAQPLQAPVIVAPLPPSYSAAQAARFRGVSARGTFYSSSFIDRQKGTAPSACPNRLLLSFYGSRARHLWPRPIIGSVDG